MSDVLVVGAGRMGLGVVDRLVRAGHSVQAVDIDPGVAQAVISSGATWAGTAVGQVAQSCTLVTVMPGSPELQDLMRDGPEGTGVLARLKPGGTWVDLTSAGPGLAAELAALAANRGIDYLDAALGGGPQAAREGTLTLYIGGDASVLEHSRRWLECLAPAGQIHHMGDHGAGYLTKLLINLLWFSQAVSVGEAMLLADSAGLDLRRVHHALATGATSSRFLDDYLPRLLGGDYAPDFGLDRCVEELASLQRYADMRP